MRAAARGEMIATEQHQDEARIRGLPAGQEATMRASDAQTLVSPYAPEIVQFDLAPPLRHTGPEVLDPQNLAGWAAGFEGPMDYEIRCT